MKLSARVKKLIIDIIIAGILLAFFAIGFLSYFDFQMQDALFQRQGLPDPNIVIIGIDEEAIAMFGTPDQWSRNLMAEAIEILNSSPEYRPAVIALDILYVGEREDADADERLTLAAKDGGNIIAAARAIPGYRYSGTSRARAVESIVGWEKPYDSFAVYADFGIVNALMDSYGRVRSTRLLYEYEDEVLYSFPYEIYRKYTGIHEPQPWANYYEKHITYSGGPGTYTYISFAEIFDEDFEPEYFADLVILIGAYAPGLMDDFYIPGYADRMNGVEIHANVLQMLLDETFKQNAHPLVNWLVLILAITLALVLAYFLEIRVLLLTYAGLIAVLIGTGLFIFYNGYIISLLYPVFSLALIYIYHLIYSYIVERLENQKAQLIAEKHQIFMDSINYASVIQRSILPKENVFAEAFADYSVLWEPRDKVGGDVYWIKNFEPGTLLCVCDCTGHGVPGALLTTLVVSSFEEIITAETCGDPAAIMMKLDQRLNRIFEADTYEKKSKRQLHIKNGCDLAILFIAKNGEVLVASGNFNVFICDGEEVTRIKGQRLYIGEGRVKNSEDVRITKIPANMNNKFYISSDGMYDQLGGPNGHSFGYNIFKRLILEQHSNEQKIISAKIWEEFEKYRGKHARLDDFELVTFKPRSIIR
ncbi:MAG: CHASE2 domain-containing protein [Lachnospiraceae bacterium]|nr:CHASE2 domain-containing protein [Lachnospiraceae bacterium]